MQRAILSATATAVCAASAAGQISPVGPFTGPYTESFETQAAMPDTLYTCLPGRIFSNAADICDPTTNSLILPSFFSLFCQATPRTGTRYAVGLEGPLEITFDAPVTRFGGYFATVGGVDGADVFFSDAAGPIGSANLTTNQCNLLWGGWESATPFTRVRIVGNSPFGEGGYIHMDDLEYAAPGSSCYANCDASTGSPLLTANDFVCFVTRYATGDSYANCDGSTGEPALNANDFTCFVNRFAAGCR